MWHRVSLGGGEAGCACMCERRTGDRRRMQGVLPRVSESLMPGKAEYSAALFRQCACSDGKGVKSVQPDLEGRHQPTL